MWKVASIKNVIFATSQYFICMFASETTAILSIMLKKSLRKRRKIDTDADFFHENIFPHPFLTSIHLIHLYVCHSFIISTCSKVKNFQARLGVSTKRKALIAQTRYNKDYPLKPKKKTCKMSLSFHEKKKIYSILNPITSL